ncbi:hypothetical protein M153_1970001242 [Pseudoloma neurophilia]|uniref:Uncharacterized protein n=1 Tax=Pseudoloma neurophilia TaxID=146866 RepID=A0A0R0M657_9MICR|nr:hypothetical protein M153_1970001242 [Pseudoloma neurophilia]
MKRNFYSTWSFFKNPCDVGLGTASYLDRYLQSNLLPTRSGNIGQKIIV